MSQPAFIRSHILELSGYVPGEQPRHQRYIKLNTNENPYPPSPLVLSSLHGAITEAIRLYPDPEASELCAKASAVYGLPPDHVLAGNGSDELLSIVSRACVGPGDRVVYPSPTYSLYRTLVALQGGVAVEVPFPDDYRLPSERLVECGQKVTIICNPNAPSGTLAPVAAIEEIAQRLRGLLVVDEAYVDFAGTGATSLPLVLRYPNVIVLRTFSKSFSLCGLRVGLAFGQPAVLTQLAKIKDSYNVNRLGQVAAAAALDDRAWMEGNAARVRSTRADLSTALRRRGFDVLPSETNFVLASRRGSSIKAFHQQLRDRGVLVRFFDMPVLQDALRIAVGTPDEMDAFFRAVDGALTA